MNSSMAGTMVLFIQAILIISPPTASAQRAVNCPGKTLEHAQCAHDAYLRADKELSRTWTKIIDNFNTTHEIDLEMKQGLLRSQRAWIVYRDAECEGSVGGIMQNGTGRPGMESICKEEFTIDRIKILLDRYGEF